MNELQARRYVKKVMSRGIPRVMAQNIVETALQASKSEKGIEIYIDYAITLTYGLNQKIK